jgi:hypothetical protein
MALDTNGATEAEVPVACTLDAAGLATQAQRWSRLLERSAVDRVETVDGLLIRFRTDEGTVAELHHLVAVENECCAWASWAVTEADGTADLVICSTGDGIAVLHGMFAN